MESTIHAIDAIEALRRLTPAEIEARLAEIDGERTALTTILRSLRAREREQRRRRPLTTAGATT